MKDYETFPALQVVSAKGSYIDLKSGRAIIDAVSSWWCKSFGHNHPVLKAALQAQVEQFEHVIFANTTYDVIENVSARLSEMTATLDKIFYVGDGSCAIEVAMKMSLHARYIEGATRRTHFIALEHAYHGETLATLSVSDCGIYRDPYQAHLKEAFFIRGIPYVSGLQDPEWEDAGATWENIENQLAPYVDTATAVIVEPVLQGAGGMKIYSPDFLKRLRQWCTQHGVHLIADEIMTGLGRTGKRFACDHASIEPDFLCLGKGLTAGWLPFSAVMTTESIYALFYDDYEKGKSFLHSHTYSGNPLGAAIALAVLRLLETDITYEKINVLGEKMRAAMHDIANKHAVLKNIRQVGAVVAADITCAAPGQRLGYAVFQAAVKKGALLRPLGNTIYWCLPFNTTDETLWALRDITLSSLDEVIGSSGSGGLSTGAAF